MGEGAKTLTSGLVGSSPMWKLMLSRGLAQYQHKRPLVMRGEGGGGGATSLGHADGQANRSSMAREG
jgi:hypothetical protein